MNSVNSEKYKLEKKNFINTNNDNKELAPNSCSYSSFSYSTPTCVNNDINSSTNVTKYQVTKIKEKITLTQKYKIVNAFDPYTGIDYDLNKIIELNLIDENTSNYRVPSTGKLIALDEAIQNGLVIAELVDELFETSNESYQYIQQNNEHTSTATNISFNENILNRVKVDHEIILFINF